MKTTRKIAILMTAFIKAVLKEETTQEIVSSKNGAIFYSAKLSW